MADDDGKAAELHEHDVEAGSCTPPHEDEPSPPGSPPSSASDQDKLLGLDLREQSPRQRVHNKLWLAYFLSQNPSLSQYRKKNLAAVSELTAPPEEEEEEPKEETTTSYNPLNLYAGSKDETAKDEPAAAVTPGVQDVDLMQPRDADPRRAKKNGAVVV